MAPFPDKIIARDPTIPRTAYSEIFGVKVDKLTLEALFDRVKINTSITGKSILESVNIHAFNQCFEHPYFRNFLVESNIVICDGFGVKIAAKIMDNTDLQRYTPADWILAFCGFCAENGLSMYFLGAASGIAQIAAENMIGKYPALEIKGIHDGYFNKTRNHPENQAVVAEIQRLRPDILVIGFGMPMQEKWVIDNWDDLDCKLFMPVGALFDYLSGNVRRAPRWMTNYGFEWLGRLLIEPKRLWKRYLIGNPLFFLRIFQQKLNCLDFPKDEKDK